jgi:putative ABC transport system permease protein
MAVLAPVPARPSLGESGAGLGDKPALPWSSAIRIAWRELQASRVKFLFVILSVAIGVGSLTGVRGFSESLGRVLLSQARGILAADLSARMNRELSPSEQARLDSFAQAEHVEETKVTELVSMAALTTDPVPLLVSLKVVDPRVYPFYGTVKLDPAESLAQLLTNSTVVVDDSLLVRLRAHVGDTLRIGGHPFRIAGLIRKEPDRLTAGVGIGPRVMMTREAVEQTGLLQPGSRWTERYLFKLTPSQAIAPIRTGLQELLPEAQVADFRESAPALTEGLNQATGLLSLICLVAMVLGAIGVAMAMRAHLQQRIDGIAIMKAMGARSSDVLRIYVLQTLMLGGAGALLGVVLGVAVEFALPAVLGTLLPLRPPIRLPLLSVSAAFGTGILTTMLFSIPPLLDVRSIRPSVVLRRLVEVPDPAQPGCSRMWGWLQKVWASPAQVISITTIVLALAGIAAALSNSWKGGLWFAGALVVSLATLLGISALLLRVLRLLLARTRLSLPSSLRQGLANLYRPGNQSAAVLAALGVGVMLILSVFLMQSSIVATMQSELATKTPNVFLIDISTNELNGLRTLLRQQPGVHGELDALPILSARITALNGVPIDQLSAEAYPRHLRRTVSLTWTDAPPAGLKIKEGAWWASGTSNRFAVIDRIAKRLHLHVGSELSFDSNGRTFVSKVAAVYAVDGQHISSRSEFIFAPAQLEGLPVIWYGAVHIAPAKIAEMQRALFAAYPTVTVINVADILDTIQSLIGQITIVIRFLAGFSILSGAVILASSVASTRFRRIREVVVLKTLGATRNRIATIFSVEFVVLGLLAGLAGTVFANALTRVLLRVIEVAFVWSLRADLIAVAATAALAVITGWSASFRILGQKPLEVLREE